MTIADPPSPATPEARRWTNRDDWIAAIAVLALWLISRPYRGVRHDATLYLGQTLARLMPERYAPDLFLSSPAQDRYSLFSPFLAPLVAHFGIGPSEMIPLVCCHALFALAVWKLGVGWTDRRLRWAAVMFVVAMPHTYGGLGQFSYAEPFLMARSIAEPLALLSLWRLLQGRLPSAIVLVLASAAFHPLVALPVMAVGWTMLALRRPAWGWLGLLLLVPPVLAVLGVAPFDGLGKRFDPVWFEIIRKPDAQVFAGAYSILDWSPFVFDLLVLALAVRVPRESEAMTRLLRATLVATAVLTAVWILGADVLHNVLLTQLQLWRVDWVLHLLAMLVLPSLLLAFWGRGLTGRWGAAALGVAGIAVVSNWPTGWACVLWAVAAVAVNRSRAVVSDRLAKGAIAISFLGMLAISVRVALYTLEAVRMSPDSVNDVGSTQVLLGLPLVVATLALVVLKLSSTPGWPRQAVAIVVVASAAFSVPLWDQRSDWQRRLESGVEGAHPVFDAEMPPGASVYWDHDIVTPWLLARRGNFFSPNQAPALLFDRGFALEYARRSATVAPFEIQREICLEIHGLTEPAAAGEPACAPNAALAAEVCRARPHPDYLVFRGPIDVPAVAQWRYTSATAAPDRRKSFYLYSCAQFGTDQMSHTAPTQPSNP